MLPDDVLLVIFDFYVNDVEDLDKKLPIKDKVEVWQLLVQVCRRWRSVVFESPRRLNLRLVCTRKTPVLKMLDIWPPFPLIVHSLCYDGGHIYDMLDNTIAALKHRDRICKINIDLDEVSGMGVVGVMQEPFPKLTDLILVSRYDTYGTVDPDLPESFLGGSAPRLRFLQLDFVGFPGLPVLLSSATHLVHLRLFGIPCIGHLLPREMVTCLSTLTNLESLYLAFTSSVFPAHESEPQHLSTRIVLPALTYFTFLGNRSCLEDFVARIDTPKLDKFSINFTYRRLDMVHTQQLDHFISRTRSLHVPENAPHVTYL